MYGPLYELFEVSDRYKTAVEVTAGTRYAHSEHLECRSNVISLFHVVVDTDDTASKILEVMNKEKGGRVTFMPINRLKSVQVQYPKANDAVPMISKLKFDRAYQMAFEQVFGRTIICEDLATATQYTRSHCLNAVTVEGDRADRKGALTGGYHDVRRSRLDTVKSVKKWRDAYEVDAARHKEVKEGIAKLDQQMTQSLGQIQVIEARRKQLLERRARHAAEASWTHNEMESSQARVEKLESALAEGEKELRDAAAKRISNEEELKTPMRQTLTNDEIRSLEKLTRDAEGQKKNLVEASQARREVSQRLNFSLTTDLGRNKSTRDRAHREPSKKRRRASRKAGRFGGRCREWCASSGRDRAPKYRAAQCDPIYRHSPRAGQG